MGKFDLIVFDCDGVLVDSEPVSNRLFTEMLQATGVAISLEESGKRFTGLSDASTSKLVFELYQRELDSDFWQTYQSNLLEELARSVTSFPGVMELVKKLGTNCCVASSGAYAKINTTLGATGLLPLFAGRIFSASEVARGKPNPDLFLFAAQKMNVDPTKASSLKILFMVCKRRKLRTWLRMASFPQEILLHWKVMARRLCGACRK